jgi:hypothetical protein
VERGGERWELERIPEEINDGINEGLGPLKLGPVLAGGWPLMFCMLDNRPIIPCISCADFSSC